MGIKWSAIGKAIVAALVLAIISSAAVIGVIACPMAGLVLFLGIIFSTVVWIFYKIFTLE